VTLFGSCRGGVGKNILLIIVKVSRSEEDAKLDHLIKALVVRIVNSSVNAGKGGCWLWGLTRGLLLKDTCHTWRWE
jgi:hypothetical protein